MDEIKPPPLEDAVGVRVYFSKTPGLGGTIKERPEDFIVEEIMPDLLVLEIDRDLGFILGEKKEYLHFTLQKLNWDNLRALKILSKKLAVSRRRFGFAGTKDKRALTTQRVSVWNIDAEELKKIRVKDMVLRDFAYAEERINLGHLWGNRFTITLRNIALGEDEVYERTKKIIGELGYHVPNFFGLQRFGTTRPITHIVGKRILERNFRDAVLTYLSAVYEGEEKISREARAFLAETNNYQEAIKRFPKHLGYEITMLNHLIVTPNDFIGALRRLPKKLRIMFVHAYQAYVFNLALSEYIRNGSDVVSLPLPGYKIKLDDITAEILEREGIKPEAFKIKEMPELSSEGLMRECFIEIKEPEVLSVDEDELNPGRRKTTVRFSLSKGSYATTVLREIMKNEYWLTTEQKQLFNSTESL